MKRHPKLRALSREHHAALVLARRASRGGDAALWASVRRAYEAELEPHFRDEELRILPALERAGEHALVARTLADHRRLRELATGPATTENARELGALLTAHVRFEERTLFPAFEQLVLV